MIKQIFYLGYWIITLDMAAFRSFLRFAQMKSHRGKTGIMLDSLYCVLRYKISIVEYFQFNFYLTRKEDRAQYVGTPLLEEYQLKMNPKTERHLLHNKLEFAKAYARFIKHAHATLADLQENNEAAANVLHNHSGKIILKNAFGEGGMGIEVISAAGQNLRSLIDRLAATGNDFVEEYVVQHNDLMRLSSSGLNTLRIITQVNGKNEVELLGATLRISVNCPVDNWHKGNLAAPVDLATGTVAGPAFYMDITKPDEYFHPVTKVEIPGFRIPFWNDAVQMAKDAAVYNRKNRSIGWDIAVTDNGPDLIEGNHNWDKVMWQRTAKRGLKPLIEHYL